MFFILNFTTHITKIDIRKPFHHFFKLICLVLIKNNLVAFYLMLQMLSVNNMVTVPAKKILVNKSKSDIEHVNSALETCTLCPSCKSDNAIITDPKSGEIICSKCGTVVSDKMLEMRPEWRTFTINETEGRARTGLPSSLARHDMGLSTVIGKENTDATKNKIEPSMLSTLHRLRTWDFRTQDRSADRTLRLAFVVLDSLKDKLGLSHAIVEKTAYIYRKAQQKRMTRGRSIHAVLAAAIYIACRQMEVPRTLDEIATIGNIKRKSIAKCHRDLILELQLKLPTIDNTKCIARVANKANISEKTKHQAMNLMDDVVKTGISAGKDPMGLAATVLYASCIKTGEQKTQVDLANAAQITEVTIRNRFKDLKNRLELHD
jgi:transcription initiation factor TFIIB